MSFLITKTSSISMINKRDLNKILYGESYRSIRKELKVFENVNLRKTNFYQTLNNNDNQLIPNGEKSLINVKSSTVLKPLKVVPKAEHKVSKDKVQSHKDRIKKEFERQMKAYKKPDSPVKNKVIAAFFARHKDQHMRRLSNPFNITPTREFLLQKEVESSKFVPNTSILEKHDSKVTKYLNVNLVDLAKSSPRSSLLAPPTDKLKLSKRKSTTIEIKPTSPADHEYLPRFMAEKVALNESVHSNIDSIHEFNEERKATKANEIEFCLRKNLAHEQVLLELESKRFETHREPLPPNLFSDVEVEQPGEQWRKDRGLLAQVNPEYEDVEKKFYEKDKKALNKRRQGNLLKNLALDQDLKVMNKKLDKDLRDKIFLKD